MSLEILVDVKLGKKFKFDGDGWIVLFVVVVYDYVFIWLINKKLVFIKLLLLWDGIVNELI